MPLIHPTACVEPGAEIADDARIGPFCVIGPAVTIGSGCELVSHVSVAGHTTVGAGTKIYPFASLGTPPQSVKYRGGATRLLIGAHCDIREGVTMNIGTEDGAGVTQVGDNGFFMTNAHIGHDCIVGSNVVFANFATLGGHCVCGDHVFMGGLSAAHQFTRIGQHAMIGGMTGLRGDVIPFALASGPTARLYGVNVVGLRRRGFSRESRLAIQQAYKLLFFGDGTFKDRLERLEAKLGSDPGVAQIIEFVRAGSNRPLCHP